MVGEACCLRGGIVADFKETISMKKIAIALLAGSGALLAHSATAADIYTTGSAPIGINELGIEQVRLVCDEFGRCYRTRPRRVIIDQDAYDDGPRERYIEGPRVGVYGAPRFVAPGIGVNIGIDDDRW
jgi:hypothetical protein